MISAASLALIVAAQTPADPVAEIRTHLDNFAKTNFRGLIYIERDGKELFYETRGEADPFRKTPFTRDTGIEIGSIVKPFVKAAVFRLAREGKLSLSDSIALYFPETPEEKKVITIEMLLGHRAGFRDIFGGDYEPMRRDELMAKMLKSKLIFAPGSKSEYSNAGYSMLATIIEMVTGQPVEMHLAEAQFKPIGMTRTGYVLPKWKPSQVTTGTYEDGGKLMEWGTPIGRYTYADGPSWNLRGNGGMVTTVADLALWCRTIHNGGFFTPAEYALFTPEISSGRMSDNGFWASAGGNGVFNCVLGYNPKRKLILIVFSADARFEIEQSLRPLVPLILAIGDKG